MFDVMTYILSKRYTDTHGGGSGTTNYNTLQNKPQINGVELEGNLSSSDLDIHANYEVVNDTLIIF